MANVSNLKPYILKWEGGFANDPVDSGGATMRGITLATYQGYCRKKGLPVPTVQDLKNISDSRWMDVLKTLFWDKWRADEIRNQGVANILVDWVWGSGNYGITIPQRVLGVKVDGIVGPKTLAAVNAANPKELFNRIYAEREKYLRDITAKSVAAYEKKIGRPATTAEKLKNTKQRFLNGWLNRLKDIKQFEP